MSDLRKEIIESQKFRGDIIKWKLVLCAVIGAFGLGALGSSGVPNAYLALLLLPAACVYCDAACAHTNLRILVIGKYASTDPEHMDYNYEQFAEKCAMKNEFGDANVFGVEDIVISRLTLAICGFSFGFGLVIILGFKWIYELVLTPSEVDVLKNSRQIGLLFVASGIFCFWVDSKIKEMFIARANKIQSIAQNIKDNLPAIKATSDNQ